MKAALVLAALLTAMLAATARAEPPRIGDAAPALVLARSDGGPFDLGAVRAPIVVVDFFATWCGPCQLAMRALDEAVRPLGGVQLVVVDVGEAPAETAAFWAAHPAPRGAIVVFDRDGAASRRWGQRRFPTTFFVDQKRVIRHINRGYGSGYAARVSAWLRGLVE